MFLDFGDSSEKVRCPNIIWPEPIVALCLSGVLTGWPERLIGYGAMIDHNITGMHATTISIIGVVWNTGGHTQDDE